MSMNSKSSLQRIMPEKGSSKLSSRSGSLSSTPSGIARKQSFHHRLHAVEMQYQKYESLENQSLLSALDSLDVQMFRAGRFLVENQITDFKNFTTFIATTTGDKGMLLKKINRLEKDLRAGVDHSAVAARYRESVYGNTIRKKTVHQSRNCLRKSYSKHNFPKEAHISDELTIIFGDLKEREKCDCECCMEKTCMCGNYKCNCCAFVKDKVIRLLSLRDGAGASVIHLAYLFQHYDIGRMLLQKYPQLSQLKYAMVDGGVDDPRMWPYLGENILHMAVAQRNYFEVKYILSMKWMTKDSMNVGRSDELEVLKKSYLLNLLSAKAYGHFFHPAYRQVGVYFGEYPIQFAVCTNDCDILDLFIMVDPYSLFITDYHGNNVLHLCVLHNLKVMYNYVVKKAEDILRGDYMQKKKKAWLGEDFVEREGETEEQKDKRMHQEFRTRIDGKVHRLLDRALLNVFNKEGYSPFTLAAAEGKSDMFHHILMHRKQMMWNYGPVGCFIVCLTHLDTNDELYGEYADDDADIDFVSKLAIHNKQADIQEIEVERVLSPQSSIVSGSSHQHQQMRSKMSTKLTDELLAAKTNLENCSIRSQSFQYDGHDGGELNALIHGEEKQNNQRRNILGAIDLICRHGHLEMLDIPEVKQIIAIKWERFGFPTFLWRSFFEICRTLSISLIVCLISYSEGESFLDWLAWSLYPVTWMWLLFNFVNDVFEIGKHGLDHYGLRGGIRGAALLENITRSLVFTFFTITCVCKFSANVKYSDSLTRIFLSLTVLTSWISVYYFLMGFEKSGNFVVIIFNIIAQDLPSFVKSFVIILFGFGSAHVALTSHQTPGGDRVGKGFNIYFQTIWEMFNHAINGQNTNELDSNVQELEHWPKKLFVVFAAAFNVCIVIIMLNLLIAMMTERYSQLKACSHLILARERFNMMIGFERSLTPEQKKKSSQGYAIMFEDARGGRNPKTTTKAGCLQSLFYRLNLSFDDSPIIPDINDVEPLDLGVKGTFCTRMMQRVRNLLVYYGFTENDGIRPNFFEMQTIDPTWTCVSNCKSAKDRVLSVGKLLDLMESSTKLAQVIDRDPEIVGCVDETGWSLLHCACSTGMESGVKLLLSNGADPNRVCTKGRTPLHDVVSWYCRTHKQQGTDINKIRGTCYAIVSQLVLAGCDHRVIDKGNLFAVDIARSIDEEEKDLTAYFLHDEDYKSDEEVRNDIDRPPADDLVTESIHPLEEKSVRESVLDSAVQSLYLDVCIMISRAQGNKRHRDKAMKEMREKMRSTDAT